MRFGDKKTRYKGALVSVSRVNDGFPFISHPQPCPELHLPFCTRVSPYASADLKPTAELRLGLWTQPSTHPPCPNLPDTEAYSRDPYGPQPCPGHLRPFRVLTGERDSSMTWSVLGIIEESHEATSAMNTRRPVASSPLPYCSLWSQPRAVIFRFCAVCMLLKTRELLPLESFYPQWKSRLLDRASL